MVRRIVIYSRERWWPSQRGTSILARATVARGKIIDSIKNISLYHCFAFIALVAICQVFLCRNSCYNIIVSDMIFLP